MESYFLAETLKYAYLIFAGEVSFFTGAGAFSYGC